ncbi:MAG: hypothetical protein QOG15_3344 [Solirubrobacteraceae bacterium]|nr:hypothetical protein [Solirubrobacteraceae bacterium]
MLRSFIRRTLGSEPLAAKVPEITALFWILKVLTTGMGESMSDFLGHESIPLAAAVGLLLFALAMVLQLRAREYRAPLYWFAVMAVAVFGTMVADGAHRGAGLPYAVTTPLYAGIVAATFWLWHRSQGTLSIHSITTRPREIYYWIAVLGTFALGTAAGDLTAISLHMGYFASAVFFAVVIAIPALLWWRSAINPILAFWAAYVITRPLGASIADWIGKPQAKTGLGVGDGIVSLLALAMFIGLVTYITTGRTGVQRPREPQPAEA